MRERGRQMKKALLTGTWLLSLWALLADQEKAPDSSGPEILTPTPVEPFYSYPTDLTIRCQKKNSLDACEGFRLLQDQAEFSDESFSLTVSLSQDSHKIFVYWPAAVGV